MNESLAPGQAIELSIDRLSFNGGRGVGRFEGMAVFVPFSAPGDQIRAVITRKHNRYLEADIQEILRPSDQRVLPFCKRFGSCGGCTWQHVSYPEQLKQKQSILEHALRPLRQLSHFEVREILASPADRAYRSRIQLHQSATKMSEKTIGFFARQSNEVIEVEDCPLATKSVNVLLQGLREQLEENPQRCFTSQELFLSEDSSLTAEGGFTQVNKAVNTLLQQQILTWLQVKAPHRLWDLYAGDGNLSRGLLDHFDQLNVLCVESDAGSVLRGQQIVAKMSPSRVEFVNQSVEVFLQKASKQKVPDVIILDPPRQGLRPQVISALLNQKAERVFYVSCHPMTFVRDAALLIKNSSMALKRIQPMDMFPQTEHLELVAEFTRV